MIETKPVTTPVFGQLIEGRPPVDSSFARGSPETPRNAGKISWALDGLEPVPGVNDVQTFNLKWLKQKTPPAFAAIVIHLRCNENGPSAASLHPGPMSQFGVRAND